MNPSLPKARVLIIVKTYPQPSNSYDELVCTAGLLDGKHWIRIYPIPFREKSFDEQFKKWEWIELDLEKRPPGKDLRIESYQPRRGIDEPIKVLGPLEFTKKNQWAVKRNILLGNHYTSMEALLAEHSSSDISLGVVRPTAVFDIKISKEEEKWTEAHEQGFLEFLPEEERRTQIKPVKPIPYKFRYHFATDDGKERNLMVEDWELGALYWNSLPADGDETVACGLVKKKLLWMWTDRDLFFVVGTIRRNHVRAENPFVIIGLFYPPRLDPPNQLPLFQ